jgi:hypothetical protein
MISSIVGLEYEIADAYTSVNCAHDNIFAATYILTKNSYKLCIDVLVGSIDTRKCTDCGSESVRVFYLKAE